MGTGFERPLKRGLWAEGETMDPFPWCPHGERREHLGVATNQGSIYLSGNVEKLGGQGTAGPV